MADSKKKDPVTWAFDSGMKLVWLGVGILVLWVLVLSMLKAVGILLIAAALVATIVFYVRRYNRLQEEHREYRRNHP
jgi:heme/copper-type cytochrome/quinol oxidase subunit 2